MTVFATIYYILMGVSALLCILNLIFSMARKKVFRMLGCFIWILLLLANGISTWVYFDGFASLNYSYSELHYIVTGIECDVLMAKICLYTLIGVAFILFLMIFVIVRRIVSGFKTGAKYAKDTVKESVTDLGNGVKDLFKKEPKEEKKTETVTEPVKEEKKEYTFDLNEPIELKLEKTEKEEIKEPSIELKFEEVSNDSTETKD